MIVTKHISYPLIATPGRLNDLLMNELLSVRSVTYLVSVFPLMWSINLFDMVCAGAGRG